MDSLDNLMMTEDFVEYRIHILPESHFTTLSEGLTNGEDPLGIFIRVGTHMEALGAAMKRLAYLSAQVEVCTQVEPRGNGNVVINLGGPRIVVQNWVESEDVRGNLGDSRRVFIAIPTNDLARTLWEDLILPVDEAMSPKLRLIIGGEDDIS